MLTKWILLWLLEYEPPMELILLSRKPIGYGKRKRIVEIFRTTDGACRIPLHLVMLMFNTSFVTSSLACFTIEALNKHVKKIYFRMQCISELRFN